MVHEDDIARALVGLEGERIDALIQAVCTAFVRVDDRPALRLLIAQQLAPAFTRGVEAHRAIDVFLKAWDADPGTHLLRNSQALCVAVHGLRRARDTKEGR